MQDVSIFSMLFLHYILRDLSAESLAGLAIKPLAARFYTALVSIIVCWEKGDDCNGLSSVGGGHQNSMGFTTL